MEVLIYRFDACPITEQCTARRRFTVCRGAPMAKKQELQNLSEWRKRGHQQWLAYRMIIDELGGLAENVDAVAGTGINVENAMRGSATKPWSRSAIGIEAGASTVLLVLTASYAVMIQRWEITPPDELKYKMVVFRNLTNGVLALRRGELQAIRIEIARERLELLREKKRNKSSSASSSGTASTSTASPSSPPHSNPPIRSTPGLQVTPGAPAPENHPSQKPERPVSQNPPRQSSARPVRPVEPRAAQTAAHPENASDCLDSLGLTLNQPVKLAA
jgi:hypothetical protein